MGKSVVRGEELSGRLRRNGLRTTDHGLSSLISQPLTLNSPMDPQTAIDLGRDAIMTSLIIGAPVLLVGVVVGLLIGLLQALTQVQDQTVSFVPKIVAMVAALSLCLPWLIERMVEYSHAVIANIPKIIAGG